MTLHRRRLGPGVETIMFDRPLRAAQSSSLARRSFRRMMPAIFACALASVAFKARAADEWTITSYPRLDNYAQLTQQVAVDNVKFGFSCTREAGLSAYLHTGTGGSLLPTVELKTWTEIEFVVEDDQRRVGFLQQPQKDVWRPLDPVQVRTLAGWLEGKGEAATLSVAFRDHQGRKRQIDFPGSVSAAVANFQKHCGARS